jgi:hypothetical protein
MRQEPEATFDGSDRPRQVLRIPFAFAAEVACEESPDPAFAVLGEELPREGNLLL